MSIEHVVLLTGGTGTLGRLAAAAFLSEGNVKVVAPVRPHHAEGAVEAAVAAEFAVSGSPDNTWRGRLCQVALPVGSDDPDGPDSIVELDALAAEHGVTEIVHCAGCLSYFNTEELRAVNVVLTQRLVEAGKRWGIKRFIHISTAFASGFVEGTIPETLHSEPSGDPTFYTESKRLGESVVAQSGLPFIIVRPSIVIGDSRDGHYAGPRYGLYQLWSGVERILMSKWAADLHYVAPRQVLPLLHQDAFAVGLIEAWRNLDDDSIIHLTSRGGPTVRAMSNLIVDQYLKPTRVHYYESISEVPMDEIESNQRTFLNLAAVNIEISSREWDFSTTGVDSLFASESAPRFADASLESVERCQRAYFEGSRRLARYRKQNADNFGAEVVVIESSA